MAKTKVQKKSLQVLNRKKATRKKATRRVVKKARAAIKRARKRR